MKKVRPLGNRFRIYAGFLTFMLALAVMGLSVEATAADSAEKYKVDASIVCMVNDNVMGRTQIPVEVEGKTYYGCCKNCVGKLKGNIAVRTAKDPFSGNDVDKASAFIIEGPKGEALYFESAVTANKFIAKYSK
ncbi:MAG: TRASH domain-containing protein [Thermodesulfobacteriota bacterium]